MYVVIQNAAENYKELYYQPGIIMAKKEGRDKYLPEFANYIADIIRHKLVEAINKQRYNYRWQALSPVYLEWKRKKGFSLNIWEATGLLKDSISYWKQGSNKFVVGIDKRKLYPKTNIKIWFVAKCMEYGTRKMPPRPLMRPIVQDVRTHVRRHWDKFCAEKGI